MASKTLRGSQKHLLDLLDASDFVSTINEILAPYETELSVADCWQPKGNADRKECYLPQFCERFCDNRFDFSSLTDWWVPKPWRPPTWDLIATCSIQKRFGILLVEAKAHEGELERTGKRLSPLASRGSKENHAQISACVAEANKALDGLCDGLFALSLLDHYQLVNRIAHLWKLANCGIPVVLLYLGFLGDTCFADHFRDDSHWQRVMGGYISGVVPQGFPNRRILVPSNGSLMFCVASRYVKEPPPRFTAQEEVRIP